MTERKRITPAERRAQRAAEEANAKTWLVEHAEALKEDTSESVQAVASGDALEVVSPLDAAERVRQAAIEENSDARWGEA